MTNHKDKYKVGRLLGEYQLEDFESELAERWSLPDGKRDSLRKLTELFNQKLLETSMQRAGMNPYRDEVKRTYEKLIDEDVPEATRTTIRRELQREGVPIEEVESDFVSHTAIYNYLTEVLEERYEHKSDEEQLQLDRDRVSKLRGRVENVILETINRLANTGRIRIDDYRIFVDIRIYCNECDNQYNIGDFLSNSGCNCKFSSE